MERNAWLSRFQFTLGLVLSNPIGKRIITSAFSPKNVLCLPLWLQQLLTSRPWPSLSLEWKVSELPANMRWPESNVLRFWNPQWFIWREGFHWEFSGHLPHINFSHCFLNKIPFLAAVLPIPWSMDMGEVKCELLYRLQLWPDARAPRTLHPICCHCWVYSSFNICLKISTSSQSGLIPRTWSYLKGRTISQYSLIKKILDFHFKKEFSTDFFSSLIGYHR